MAASPSEKQIRQHLLRMARKYPGVTFVVLRASNGEVAIVDETQTSWGREGKPRPANIMSAIANRGGAA